LAQATETLDSGDPESAIPLLDAALSHPLGAEQGLAMHEAGRQFEPATGVAEIVSISPGLCCCYSGPGCCGPAGEGFD